MGAYSSSRCIHDWRTIGTDVDTCRRISWEQPNVLGDDGTQISSIFVRCAKTAPNYGGSYAWNDCLRQLGICWESVRIRHIGLAWLLDFLCKFTILEKGLTRQSQQHYQYWKYAQVQIRKRESMEHLVRDVRRNYRKQYIHNRWSFFHLLLT